MIWTHTDLNDTVYGSGSVQEQNPYIGLHVKLINAVKRQDMLVWCQSPLRPRTGKNNTVHGNSTLETFGVHQKRTNVKLLAYGLTKVQTLTLGIRKLGCVLNMSKIDISELNTNNCDCPIQQRYILSTFEKKMRFLQYLTENLTSFLMLSNSWKLMWYFLKYNFYKVWISIIFFIFCTLFCSLSQNKPGRQNVPFVVLATGSQFTLLILGDTSHDIIRNCTKIIANLVSLLSK